MGKPYSIDLRERVIGAVEMGGMSRHEAARAFDVGVSTVITWVRRFRETGSMAPGRLAATNPRPSAASTGFFYWSGRRPVTSRCEGSWPNWASGV